MPKFSLFKGIEQRTEFGHLNKKIWFHLFKAYEKRGLLSSNSKLYKSVLWGFPHEKNFIGFVPIIGSLHCRRNNNYNRPVSLQPWGPH